MRAFCSLVSCSNGVPKQERAANSRAVTSAQNVLPVPGGPYRITCPLRSSTDSIRPGIPVKRGGTDTLSMVATEVEVIVDTGEVSGSLIIGDAPRICFSTSTRLASFFILYTVVLSSGSGSFHSSRESHSTARRLGKLFEGS